MTWSVIVCVIRHRIGTVSYAKRSNVWINYWTHPMQKSSDRFLSAASNVSEITIVTAYQEQVNNINDGGFLLMLRRSGTCRCRSRTLTALVGRRVDQPQSTAVSRCTFIASPRLISNSVDKISSNLLLLVQLNNSQLVTFACDCCFELKQLKTCKSVWLRAPFFVSLRRLKQQSQGKQNQYNATDINMPFSGYVWQSIAVVTKLRSMLSHC